MELTRRQFGASLLASAALVLTGAWKYSGLQACARFVRAAKVKVFPGRLVPFDSAHAGRPGSWSG